MFEMSDLLRMKVSELKGQLSKLGLNTKGNKIQLVQRLAEFLSIDCNVGAAPVEADNQLSSSEPKQKKSKKSTATRSKMEARVASREPTAEDYINACSRDLSIVLERIDPLMTGGSSVRATPSSTSLNSIEALPEIASFLESPSFSAHLQPSGSASRNLSSKSFPNITALPAGQDITQERPAGIHLSFNPPSSSGCMDSSELLMPGHHDTDESQEGNPASTNASLLFHKQLYQNSMDENRMMSFIESMQGLVINKRESLNPQRSSCMYEHSQGEKPFVTQTSISYNVEPSDPLIDTADFRLDDEYVYESTTEHFEASKFCAYTAAENQALMYDKNSNNVNASTFSFGESLCHVTTGFQDPLLLYSDQNYNPDEVFESSCSDLVPTAGYSDSLIDSDNDPLIEIDEEFIEESIICEEEVASFTECGSKHLLYNNPEDMFVENKLEPLLDDNLNGSTFDDTLVRGENLESDPLKLDIFALKSSDNILESLHGESGITQSCVEINCNIECTSSLQILEAITSGDSLEKGESLVEDLNGHLQTELKTMDINIMPDSNEDRLEDVVERFEYLADDLLEAKSAELVEDFTENLNLEIDPQKFVITSKADFRESNDDNHSSTKSLNDTLEKVIDPLTELSEAELKETPGFESTNQLLEFSDQSSSVKGSVEYSCNYADDLDTTCCGGAKFGLTELRTECEGEVGFEDDTIHSASFAEESRPIDNDLIVLLDDEEMLDAECTQMLSGIENHLKDDKNYNSEGVESKEAGNISQQVLDILPKSDTTVKKSLEGGLDTLKSNESESITDRPGAICYDQLELAEKAINPIGTLSEESSNIQIENERNSEIQEVHSNKELHVGQSIEDYQKTDGCVTSELPVVESLVESRFITHDETLVKDCSESEPSTFGMQNNLTYMPIDDTYDILDDSLDMDLVVTLDFDVMEVGDELENISNPLLSETLISTEGELANISSNELVCKTCDDASTKTDIVPVERDEPNADAKDPGVFDKQIGALEIQVVEDLRVSQEPHKNEHVDAICASTSAFGNDCDEDQIRKLNEQIEVMIADGKSCESLFEESGLENIEGLDDYPMADIINKEVSGNCQYVDYLDLQSCEDVADATVLIKDSSTSDVKVSDEYSSERIQTEELDLAGNKLVEYDSSFDSDSACHDGGQIRSTLRVEENYLVHSGSKNKTNKHFSIESENATPIDAVKNVTCNYKSGSYYVHSKWCEEEIITKDYSSKKQLHDPHSSVIDCNITENDSKHFDGEISTDMGTKINCHTITEPSSSLLKELASSSKLKCLSSDSKNSNEALKRLTSRKSSGSTLRSKLEDVTGFRQKKQSSSSSERESQSKPDRQVRCHLKMSRLKSSNQCSTLKSSNKQQRSSGWNKCKLFSPPKSTIPQESGSPAEKYSKLEELKRSTLETKEIHKRIEHEKGVLENTLNGAEEKINELSENISLDKQDIDKKEDIRLDSFTCDLNLQIDEDGFICTPISCGELACLWGNVRSNFGVKQGKVCFQVKVLEKLNVDHLPSDITPSHGIRIGFSFGYEPLQLGREALTYAYDSLGNTMSNGMLGSGVEPFHPGDIITAYADLTKDPILLSFSKNDMYFDSCFSIPASSTDGFAIFPHVATRNCSFQANFGGQKSLKDQWSEPEVGFTAIGCLKCVEKLKRQSFFSSEENFKILMMCGLPGSGKTQWVRNFLKRNSQECFTVLGTDFIINKMEVNGNEEKWVHLANKCMQKLLTRCSQIPRNYILDQTNVYKNARKKKLEHFAGFKCKLVVTVPPDAEYRRRCKERKGEGRSLPDAVLFEMKRNFRLPRKNETSQLEVEFVEEDEQGAQEIVQLYNKEGKSYYMKHLKQQSKNYNSPSKNDPHAPSDPTLSITKSPRNESNSQAFDCSELEKSPKSDLYVIKSSSSLPSQVTSSDISLLKQPPSSSASSPMHSSIMEEQPEIHSKPDTSVATCKLLSQAGESYLGSTLEVSCSSISSYANVDQQQEKRIEEKDSAILKAGTQIISSARKSILLEQRVGNDVGRGNDAATSCSPIVISVASFKTTQTHIKTSSIVEKDKQNKPQVQKPQLISSTFQDSTTHLSSNSTTSKLAKMTGTETNAVATASILFPENFKQMMQYPPPTYYQTSSQGYYPYMTYAYQHPYYALQYQQYYGYQYPATALPTQQQQFIQQPAQQDLSQQVQQTISQQPAQLPPPLSSHQVQQHQQHWTQQTNNTSQYSNSVSSKSCSLQQYSYQSSSQQQNTLSSPSNQPQVNHQEIIKSTRPSVIRSSAESADGGDSFRPPKMHDVCQYDIESNQQKQQCPTRQSTQSTSHSRQPFWQPPSSTSSLHQPIEKLHVSTSSKNSSVNDFWQLPIFSTEKDVKMGNFSSNQSPPLLNDPKKRKSDDLQETGEDTKRTKFLPQASSLVTSSFNSTPTSASLTSTPLKNRPTVSQASIVSTQLFNSRLSTTLENSNNKNNSNTSSNYNNNTNRVVRPQLITDTNNYMKFTSVEPEDYYKELSFSNEADFNMFPKTAVGSSRFPIKKTLQHKSNGGFPENKRYPRDVRYPGDQRFNNSQDFKRSHQEFRFQNGPRLRNSSRFQAPHQESYAIDHFSQPRTNSQAYQEGQNYPQPRYICQPRQSINRSQGQGYRPVSERFPQMINSRMRFPEERYSGDDLWY